MSATKMWFNPLALKWTLRCCTENMCQGNIHTEPAEGTEIVIPERCQIAYFFS